MTCEACRVDLTGAWMVLIVATRKAYCFPCAWDRRGRLGRATLCEPVWR